MSKKSNAAKIITEPIKQPNFMFLNNYRDRTTRKTIVTETFIEKLADELVDWALREERPTSIEKFLVTFGLNVSDLDTIRKKYSYFNGAFQFTKMIIGMDIEEKGLYREMDPGSAERKLNNYLSRSRKGFKWTEKVKAQARAAEEKKKEPIAFNINMVDYSKKVEPIIEEKKKSKSKKS